MSQYCFSFCLWTEDAASLPLQWLWHLSGWFHSQTSYRFVFDGGELISISKLIRFTKQRGTCLKTRPQAAAALHGKAVRSVTLARSRPSLCRGSNWSFTLAELHDQTCISNLCIKCHHSFFSAWRFRGPCIVLHGKIHQKISIILSLPCLKVEWQLVETCVLIAYVESCHQKPVQYSLLI